MLSLTANRTPIASAGRSLIQSRASKMTLLAKTVKNRVSPQLVLCRFRHSEAVKPRKFQGSDRTSHASSYRTSGSPRSNREFGGREFGGQEFNAHWEVTALKSALDRFRIPKGMQQHLESLGTPRETAKDLIAAFSARALKGEIPEVNKKAIATMAADSLESGMTFKSMGVTREEAITGKLDKVMWDAFFSHCEDQFPPDALFRLSRLREIADLRYPAEWNPLARRMKRKIIMHVGPTNSGKTHQALLRLQAAETGAYLSPLRLLAHEIFDRMNDAGKPCNLVTGEERRYGAIKEDGKPDLEQPAGLVSCTIEMADFRRTIDVAVVDEIQMLADQDRGWAWTHALLGLPAREIHLCGEPTVVNLVKKICALADEKVEVREYNRLSKLEVQDESLHGGLHKIQKGDCVVTFSRKSIFSLKKAIEAETGLRCAVAYGSLPPESRSTQAKLFNDPNSGYDVLVASDAIGMGLNLNIRRVIFEAVEKFDGSVVRSLSLTQLKQIAGRAGRFGTDYAVGQATTLVQGDIPALKRALAAPMLEIQRAAIQPTADIIELFSQQMPGAKFSHVLRTFEMMCRNSELFFAGQLRNMISAAEVLDKIKLTVRERVPFISAPIQVRDPLVVDAALRMARSVSQSKPLGIDEVLRLPSQDAKGLDLKKLESSHRIIMLYLWLSQRFSDIIAGGVDSVATVRKVECEHLIEKALKENQDKRIKQQQDRIAKLEGKKHQDGQNVDKEETGLGVAIESSPDEEMDMADQQQHREHRRPKKISRSGSRDSA